ncbi:HIT family protein [Chloroflexia bacterium SDU3-3]|nr:HIT family protein [Chloroflexia bacterium SDU3-3]
MSTPSSSPHSGCITCALIEQRDQGERPLWDSIYRTSHWDVAHAYDSALPGWLVLVVRRHITSVAALTRDESVELGLLIATASQALEAAVGCQKTYVVQFAEAQGHPHVHVHIIPRMPDIPDDRRGPRVFGYLGVPEAERVPEDAMNRIAEQVRAYLFTAHRMRPGGRG